MEKPAVSKVLRALPIPSQRDIKDHQTKVLSEFVADIERENLTAIAVVGETADGRTLIRYTFRKHADLLAAVAMLQHDVISQSYTEVDIPPAE